MSRAIAGEHRSVFQGTGIEFESVREYAFGDDVRAIDWNVTARCGRPFVKRYVESRERAIRVAVDASPSMEFGHADRSKADVALDVVLVLAVAAEFARDPIGVVGYTDRVAWAREPSRGPGWTARLVQAVAQETARASAGGGRPASADLDPVIRHLRQRTHRGDAVFLVSDFHAAPPRRALAALARRQDLVCVCVSDPRERALAGDGVLNAVDPETGRRFRLDLGDDRERRAFARAAEARRAEVAAVIARSGAERIDLATDDDVLAALLRFFRRRVEAR